MALEMIADIFEVCILPLLAVLTGYAVQFIRAKSAETAARTENETAQKYIKMIEKTITDCIIATNQTYTNSLKEQGKFDEEAQKIAFEKSFNAIMAILSEDAKDYIIATTGDINVYLTQKIEAEVSKNRITPTQE